MTMPGWPLVKAQATSGGTANRCWFTRLFRAAGRSRFRRRGISAKGEKWGGLHGHLIQHPSAFRATHGLTCPDSQAGPVRAEVSKHERGGLALRYLRANGHSDHGEVSNHTSGA